jgi:hypothetical protein
VWTCAAALLPRNIEVGLLGGEMLKLATAVEIRSPEPTE